MKIAEEQSKFTCQLIKPQDLLRTLQKVTDACLVLARRPLGTPVYQMAALFPSNRGSRAKLVHGKLDSKHPATYMNRVSALDMVTACGDPGPFLVLTQEDTKLANFFEDVQTMEVKNWLDKVFPAATNKRKPELLTGLSPAEKQVESKEGFDPFDL